VDFRDPPHGAATQIGLLPPLYPEVHVSHVGDVGVIAFNFFQAQVRKTLTRIDAIAHMVLATFTKDEGERDGTAPVRAEAKG